MTSKMMMTVASAALIAGLSTASAQSPNMQPGGTATPKLEQQAPKATPNAQIEHKGSAQMDRRSNAQVEQKGGVTTGQVDKSDKAMPKAAQDRDDPRKSRAQANDKNDMPNRDAQKDRAQPNQKADTRRDAQRDSQKDNPRVDAQKDQKGSTTGQGAAPGRAGAAVQINESQRTRIKQTINIQSAPKVTNVNFSLSLGTRVPRTVRFAALPMTIIEVVPEYRGFLYFVAGSQIIIVAPETYEIVAVIPA